MYCLSQSLKTMQAPCLSLTLRFWAAKSKPAPTCPPKILSQTGHITRSYHSTKSRASMRCNRACPVTNMKSSICGRQGRQLIYELSAQHRASLLLNYAIQKILRAGHEDEVASVGTSLASYFSVFHRLLANRLDEVPTATTERLDALAAELKVQSPDNLSVHCSDTLPVILGTVIP